MKSALAVIYGFARFSWEISRAVCWVWVFYILVMTTYNKPTIAVGEILIFALVLLLMDIVDHLRGIKIALEKNSSSKQ